MRGPVQQIQKGVREHYLKTLSEQRFGMLPKDDPITVSELATIETVFSLTCWKYNHVFSELEFRVQRVVRP